MNGQRNCDSPVIIRASQLDALQQVPVRSFESEMVTHLSVFNPHHARMIGEEGLRQVIRLGLEKAAGFGLTQRGPVRLYLEAMVMLGSDFATDPLYSWAGGILGDATLPQMDRAGRLFEALQRYRDNVGGKESAFERAAFLRVRSFSWQNLTLPSTDFAPACAARLEQYYPEKTAYIGPVPLNAMIAEASALSEQHGITSREGGFLFVALSFMLGHGFTADPLYPWVSGTLKNGAVADPDRRADRLCSKAKTYLDAVAEHLKLT